MLFQPHKHLLCGITILLAIFSFFLPTLTYANLPPKPQQKILLLNSYHKGYSWTDSITKGIENTLTPYDTSLYIEYMDSKRQCTDQFLKLLEKMLTLKHKNIKYDLIITSDDNAFKFMKNHGTKIFGDIPHVFCGVNNLQPNDINTLTNSTGINEKVDLIANVNLIRNLHPECKKIYFISDQTTTGQKLTGEIAEFINTNPDAADLITQIAPKTFKELESQLKKISPPSVILLGAYFRDTKGTYIAYQKNTNLICNNSSVPVYGLWDFQLGHGITGGKLVSGELQGKAAANYGLQILNGRKASEIPVLYETPTQYAFDYNKLKKFNIHLETLPAKSIIKNQPASFYKQHKLSILIASTILSIFLLTFLGVSYGLIKARNAEKTLKRNEENLRTTLLSIGDAVITTDQAGLIIQMNPAAEKLTGWKLENALNKTLSEVFVTPGSSIFTSKSFSVSQFSPIKEKATIISQNGESRQISITAAPIRETKGKIFGIVLVFRDITKELETQNQQQDRLVRIQKQQKALIDMSTNPHVLEGNFKRAAETLTPLIAQTLDVERVGIWTFYAAKQELICLDLYQQSSNSHSKGTTFNANSIPTYIEAQLKDWAIISNDSLSDPRFEDLKATYLIPNKITSNLEVAIKIQGQLKGILCIEHVGPQRKWQDDEATFATGITDQLAQVYLLQERKETEELLTQSRKMDAIGQLAGGIAHDFNNMLTGIINSAQLLGQTIKVSDKKENKLIQIILEAAERAADLTGKLLAFSRRGKIAKQAVNCHNILKNTISILSRTINKNIEIKDNLNAINSIVIGDNSELQNVLMNIGINASHAMPKGGELSFSTQNVNLNETYCSISPFTISPGEFLEIEIRDTGCGIPFENQKKIFEPFFTTKEAGKGTGLGLATVYGIIQKHNGAITLYSEENKGTVFHLFIPSSQKNSQINKSSPEIIKGSGNILLVDDEKVIRATGKFMLENMGYKVTVANNGKEAVDTYKKNNQNFDLVIMDMLMPEMNGQQAFFELKEINKDCKIIISSGFTKDNTMEDMKKAGLIGFIQKPYRDYELSKIVSNALNS